MQGGSSRRQSGGWGSISDRRIDGSMGRGLKGQHAGLWRHLGISELYPRRRLRAMVGCWGLCLGWVMA